MFDRHESDLPELGRLAAGGCKWVARDMDEELYAYIGKPSRFPESAWAGYGAVRVIEESILESIAWDDEPLNIADAIAQIKAKKPVTNKDVLLQRWTSDTEAMAMALIERDLEDGGYFFHSATTKSGTGYTEFYQVALAEEIAYLNSPYKEESNV